MRFLELQIDVTAAVGLAEEAHTKVTAVLPDPSKLPAVPIVCFALPGGGYSRRYFTFDMPGSSDAWRDCARGGFNRRARVGRFRRA